MSHESRPLVGIVTATVSDLSFLKPGLDLLEERGIPYETKSASAHRVPNMGQAWAKTAHERGVKVIIVASGASTHLGGIIASFTPLPVIFVPTKRTDHERLDAMLSMDRNGSGAPVAAVCVDGAKDAAAFALRIVELLGSVSASRNL